MMASIPNMRSSPLPIPTAKATQAGDPACGGFAIELPAVPAPVQPGQPGQPVQPAPTDLPIESVALTPLDPLDSIVPSLPAPEDLKQGAAPTGDDEEAKPKKATSAAGDGLGSADIVVPFLPIQQAVPVVSDAGDPPATTAAAAPRPASTPAAPAPAILPGKAPDSAGAAKPAKPTPPAPAEAEAPAAPVAAAELEAVVKTLIQRKQALAKPATALSRAGRGDAASPGIDAARTEASPAPSPQGPGPASTTPPALQAAAPPTGVEPSQPSLSPTAARPMPAATEKSVVDGTRSIELATTERKLDLARDSAWLDRLARDIARAASDDAPLRFRLHPQTLGHLQVELQQGDRGTAVRMTVDTEAARQILADAQPRLAAEARAQGVRIAETHVDLSGSGRQAPGDQRRQDEARQTPFIRTAPGAGAETANAARTARRARLDRYA